MVCRTLFLLPCNSLEIRYNLGYTPKMKTAISIPDPLFQAAEQAAQRLCISRSEFYGRAVAALLADLETCDVTAALNEVYQHEDSSLDRTLDRLQTASLPHEPW